MGKLVVAVERFLLLCVVMLLFLTIMLPGIALAQQPTRAMNPTQGHPPEVMGKFRWIRTPQNCSIWAETNLHPNNIIEIESCRDGKAYGRVVFKSGSFEIGRWGENVDNIHVGYFYDGFAVSLISTIKLSEKREPQKKDQLTCFEHTKAYKPIFHALPNILYPAIYVGEISNLSDNGLVSQFGAGTTIWMAISGGIGNNETYSKIGLCKTDHRNAVLAEFDYIGNLLVGIQNTSKFEDVPAAISERLIRSVYKLTLAKVRDRKLGGAKLGSGFDLAELNKTVVNIANDKLSETYIEANVSKTCCGIEAPEGISVSMRRP